ncbi:FAD-binding oxidoreductase [Kaistia dalseonensis]|uniref:D-amino-acid dehydrogenase n=1 Tax=Kaistia dalseonensis TaxID=410840 RepID=A0ABU0HAE5_9HYPH|nr:FAD-binding oxidoreductase [Kaistia dalseonensis]MCX5496622.1 FAD-binding oxidoreductase [Kaistia dalseonensis]MDQ0439245.1 D-amino-acid dehydrogenase [Kaistia dalseonensis]
MTEHTDVIIVGAGIVGLSSALHLQERGLKVMLLDPGDERRRASFGNAGVLSRNSIFPVASPDVRKRLIRYALGRDIAVRARLRSLPALMPWVEKFLLAANDTAWRRSAALFDALVSKSFESHIALADLVGARHLIRRNGWMRLYRSEAAFSGSAIERSVLAQYGIAAEPLTAADIDALEPCLARRFTHGLFFSDSGSVESPGTLVQYYRKAVTARGGRFIDAKADRIVPRDDGVTVYGCERTIEARFAVLAAGAWSGTLARTLGYRIPLAAERGYHRHFRLGEGVELRRPIHDAAGGYVMSPMNGTVRLLSGVELARPDDPPNYRQIEAVTRDAAGTIALGSMLDETPWMGSRPSTPDGLPVIGLAPRHRRLVFAFGHGHIGFANGPITGRIVAALIANETPPVAIEGFSPARFGA